MKKKAAQVLAVIGILMFAGSWYMIYQILVYTKAVNSGPDPPMDVVVYANAPICNCNITHGLAWNILAVVMSLGVVISVAGLAIYRLRTRKGIASSSSSS